MVVLDMPSKLKQDTEEKFPSMIQLRFAYARREVGFPLKKVAEGAGISFQAIAQFEKGQQSLKIEHFVAACDAMHVRVEWVLKGKGEIFDGEKPEPTSRLKRPAHRKDEDQAES